jgi:hypothetical protein
MLRVVIPGIAGQPEISSAEAYCWSLSGCFSELGGCSF